MSLEILYNTATLEVRAWNGDDTVQGHFNPKPGQAVVIFPGESPNFESDQFYVDLPNQQVVGNPDYVPLVDPDEELVLAIEAATTIGELKEALLGKNPKYRAKVKAK